MMRFEFVLLLSQILSTVHSTTVQVSTTPNGDSKFSAVITISATEKVNGWEVILKFNSPVLKIDVSNCRCLLKG